MVDFADARWEGSTLSSDGWGGQQGHRHVFFRTENVFLLFDESTHPQPWCSAPLSLSDSRLHCYLPNLDAATVCRFLLSASFPAILFTAMTALLLFAQLAACFLGEAHDERPNAEIQRSRDAETQR